MRKDFQERELTQKIRTNKEIASFVRNLLNLNDVSDVRYQYHDIDILYADNVEEADDIIDLYRVNKGYVFIKRGLGRAAAALCYTSKNCCGNASRYVEARNSEVPPEDTHEKAERFDVNCRIDDGSQVDLEMQVSRIEEESDGKHQNLKGKSIYYKGALR